MFKAILVGAFVWSVTAEEAADPDMELPDIDAVLAEASGSHDEFTEKLSNMQANVAKKQGQSEALLSQKKARFESKLSAQVDKNKELAVSNDRLRDSLHNLQKGNEALLFDTKSVRSSNRLLRSALLALEPKMQIANEFLGQALRIATTDSAEELQVLKPPVPEPTLDHFLEIVRNDATGNSKEAKPAGGSKVAGAKTRQDDGVTSLLELSASSTSARRHRGPKEKGAEEFVTSLSQGLETLEKAQQEAYAKLKAQFLAQNELGQKKTDQLLEVQAKLNEKIEAVQARQAELHNAKSLVMKTREELVQRIQGVRVFVETADNSVGEALSKARSILGRNPEGDPQ